MFSQVYGGFLSCFNSMVNVPGVDNFFVQLNEYETLLYFLQLSQNLTWDGFLISVYLPVFTHFCMMCPKNGFVLVCKTILWAHHAKTGKKRKICTQMSTNYLSRVKLWLNWIKYGAVSYSLSYINLKAMVQMLTFFINQVD